MRDLRREGMAANIAHLSTTAAAMKANADAMYRRRTEAMRDAIEAGASLDDVATWAGISKVSAFHALRRIGFHAPRRYPTKILPPLPMR